MDGFGVKYLTKDNARHLITSLQESYDITIDWPRQTIFGLDIEWNYDKQYVDISMKYLLSNICIDYIIYFPRNYNMFHIP